MSLIRVSEADGWMSDLSYKPSKSLVPITWITTLPRMIQDHEWTTRPIFGPSTVCVARENVDVV